MYDFFLIKPKNKQTPSTLCCEAKLAYAVSGADGEGGSHLGQHPGDGRGNWTSLGQTRRRGVICGYMEAVCEHT